jgi:hypothetical protein
LPVFKLGWLGDLNNNSAVQALMDDVALCLIGLHGHLTSRAWFQRLVTSRRFHGRYELMLRMSKLNYGFLRVSR